MHRPLAALVAATAFAGLSGCIIIDVGDPGGFDAFNDDDFDDFGGFDDFDEGSLESAQVRGDIGPSRGIDSDARVDGWVGTGSLNAEVTGIDQDGGQILSIVDVYGLRLEPGARSSEVTVIGCAGAGDFEDDYEYDDYSDEGEAVVVPCGCGEEGVVDVVVTSSFAGQDSGYGRQQHTTTLRVRL